MLTLGGRFLRSIGLDYSPEVLAVRPDGRLLVGEGGVRGLTYRVELMTQFGSLLQVWLSHVYTANIRRMDPLYTALALASLDVSLALYSTHPLATTTHVW